MFHSWLEQKKMQVGEILKKRRRMYLHDARFACAMGHWRINSGTVFLRFVVWIIFSYEYDHVEPVEG